MNGWCGNIYKNAREHAGMKQIIAAEKLNMCDRTLQSYELSEKVPHIETVVRMTSVYHYPFLWHRHIESIAGTSEIIKPRVIETNLERASLKVLSAVNSIQRLNDEIIDIVSDGVVSKSESSRWKPIEQSARHAISALTEMLIHAQESMIHV